MDEPTNRMDYPLVLALRSQLNTEETVKVTAGIGVVNGKWQRRRIGRKDRLPGS